MVEGIILAGGFSSRTKQNKMTLKLKGKEIIFHTIETMHKVCERIIIVTGHYHKELKDLLQDYEYIHIAENIDYQKGMFSSVKVGVREVKNNFFIIPGDYPLVSLDTYKNILRGTKSIRVPSYNKHLGHPLYVDFSLKDEILNGGYENLKAFRNAFDFEYIEVDDENILIDIDTMKDFKAIEERIDTFGN